MEPLASGLRLPPAPPRPPAPPSGGERPPPGGGAPGGRPDWGPRAPWSFGEWIREVQGEMRRVAWPARSSVVGNSFVVVGSVVLVVGLIAGFDVCLTRIATALF